MTFSPHKGLDLAKICISKTVYKHKQIGQVKMSSRLLVSRLVQSVEHGTLNITRSGIPWVRAPRWAKLDLIFLLFFQYPD